MKKITNLLLIAFVAFSIASCKKEGVTVTKIIDVNMNANETYSSQLTPGDADDILQITSQAQHFTTSSITVDPSTGTNLFQYKPALNYVGTDEVQITNAEGDHHQGGHHHNGQCNGGHHHDDQTIYIYKINIKGVNTATGHISALINPSF